jgi:hypothetical protein
MATPTCAGVGAVLRQYYTEGWHVSGTLNTGAGINPSGSLIKATMINGAKTDASQIAVCICMHTYVCTY